MCLKALNVLLCFTAQNLEQASFLLEDPRLLPHYLYPSLSLTVCVSLCLLCIFFFFLSLCASAKVKQCGCDFYSTAGDQHLITSWSRLVGWANQILESTTKTISVWDPIPCHTYQSEHIELDAFGSFQFRYGKEQRRVVEKWLKCYENNIFCSNFIETTDFKQAKFHEECVTL